MPDWGALPADLLRAVLSALDPPQPHHDPTNVLTFEERERAEARVKKWCSALQRTLLLP